MSDGGRNWTPWSTYKTGAYQRYLGPSVDTQIDGSGVVDPNGSTDAPDASHFDMPQGRSLSSMDVMNEQHAEQIAYTLGFGPAPSALPEDLAGAAAPTGGLGSGTSPAGQPDDNALQTFLHAAVAQRGDQYIFGAKGTGQADPTAFDCSGLTQWAAHQAGVELPDGAAHQYVFAQAARAC